MLQWEQNPCQRKDPPGMQEDQYIEWKQAWRDEYLKWHCGANRGSAWPNSRPIARIWPLLGAGPTIGSLAPGVHQEG